MRSPEQTKLIEDWLALARESIDEQDAGDAIEAAGKIEEHVVARMALSPGKAETPSSEETPEEDDSRDFTSNGGLERSDAGDRRTEPREPDPAT